MLGGGASTTPTTTTQATQVSTSGDGTTRKLAATTPPPFAQLAAVGAQPVVVDVGTRHQEMTGFGASVTDATAFAMTRRMSAVQRAAIIEELFGPAPANMGLSFIRISMGASDFSPTNATYDDQPLGGSDYGLQQFSVAPDERDRIAVLQQILALNPRVKIIAAPWSPPAWMKLDPTVGTRPSSATNNKLNPAYRIAYAQYFVKFIQAYARFGINIWGLSPQNEPGAAAQGFACMGWTAAEQIDFIGKYLGPAFDAAGIKTKIIGYDDAWRSDSVGGTYALALLADATCNAYLDGIAWHWYLGDPVTQRLVQRAYPTKKHYMTEFCGFPGGPAGTMANFMRLCYIGSVRYGSSAVCSWNLARDLTNADNNNSYGSSVVGVVSIDAATGAVTRNVDYYALGHTSKYVMPGAVRIAADSYDAAVQTIAYENPDGSIALVCWNSSASAQTFQIIDARMNQGFPVTLPAGETATFAWNGVPAGTGASSFTAPGAPTSLTATAARGANNLSWIAPASGAPLSGYRILSGSTPGGESALVALVDPAITTWSDTSASTTAPTYYTVQAVNGGGAGTASNEASAQALAAAAPAAPSIVVESDGTTLAIAITPGADNGAARTNFTIYRGTTPGGESGTALTTLSPGVTYYVDTTASVGTTYYYTAKQANTIGTSAASVEGSGAIGSPTPSVGTPLVDINPAAMGMTDGQTTRTLADSSGNGHNGTINAFFDPVTYRATGVDSGPALESINSTGVADFGNIAALFASGGTFVWRGEITDTSYALLTHRSTVTGAWLSGGAWTTPLWITRILGYEQFQKASAPSTGVHTISIRADGTTYDVRLDGVQVGTHADVAGGYAYDAGTIYQLLGPTPFTGKTKRALLYGRKLRNAEIVAVEAAVGP